MRLLLILCSAWLLAGDAWAWEPQGDTGAHDPTLLIQGDRWFVFTTGRGLQRLASDDAGTTWRRLAPMFGEPPAWWADAVPEHKGPDVWAPKLFQHRGRTWVLYSISTFGKNRSAIGLASSDRPDGDWRDEGLVVQSRAEDGFNAIDPDLFVDTDGKLWLSYGSFWGGIEAPTIARHGDWLYLFASYDLCCRGAQSTYNIRVGRARNVEGPYLDRDGKDLMDADGRWYTYFAASERDDIWKLRMYVLECQGDDPLRDAWVERGQIVTPEEGFSLDATPFEHNGRRYLCWAQKSPPMESNLYLAEMANPWTLKSEPVVITRPDLAWERIGFCVNEGPAVLKRNGRIFIAYSAAATDANYCMGLLWADENADLLDAKSWSKSPTPVFTTDESVSQFGPGHNSFTTTPDGRTDLLVYHARNYRDIVGDPLNDPNRHTRAQAFGWRDDGFPDFGAPVADGLYSI
ncbi:family 43 glycosylhydrolase [Roseateles sp. P5_E4]